MSTPRVQYEIFRGTFESWDTLFSQAARFASKIGKERVINVSHSASHSDGVVTVWYWA